PLGGADFERGDTPHVRAADDFPVGKLDLHLDAAHLVERLDGYVPAVAERRFDVSDLWVLAEPVHGIEPDQRLAAPARGAPSDIGNDHIGVAVDRDSRDAGEPFTRYHSERSLKTCGTEAGSRFVGVGSPDRPDKAASPDRCRRSPR